MARIFNSIAQRLIQLERAYEYSYTMSESASIPTLVESNLEFFAIRDEAQIDLFTWELGEIEAASVKRLINNGDIVGVLHRDHIVHARLALRLHGWVTTAARRHYRRLRPGEGCFHFMRTAKFARGNRLQAKIHPPFYDLEEYKRLHRVVSTVDSKNSASIKGIERSGGVRVAKILSIGFMGGRLGWSITRKL